MYYAFGKVNSGIFSMEESKLSIRVNIAERYYPLKVERNDEEQVRLATKLVNEKMLSFKQLYANKDVQDWLALASLFLALKAVESERNQNMAAATKGLQDLDSKLSEFLDYAAENSEYA